MRLIIGYDRLVCDWVAERIPTVEAFVDAAAIGVAPDDEDILIAGAVYHEYVPKFETIEVSIAADSPRWAQKGIIRAMLHYPFEQLGVNKLWSAIPVENERAIKFNLGIGFRREAILGSHAGPGKNVMITRMLQKEYQKRYKDKAHEITVAA